MSSNQTRIGNNGLLQIRFPIFAIIVFTLTLAINTQLTAFSFSSTALAATSTSIIKNKPVIAVKPPIKLGNRIIIKKINVDAPIVESNNSKSALMRGMWRLPKTSTPEKGSNTVISGHRWLHKYPHKVTFWALNKVVKGDEIQIEWNGKTYYYKVTETKIVNAYATSILKATKDPTLTLFTCDPIYVGNNRLVVIAKPFSPTAAASTSTPKIN